jgi:hypothetical protein
VQQLSLLGLPAQPGLARLDFKPEALPQELLATLLEHLPQQPRFVLSWACKEGVDDLVGLHVDLFDELQELAAVYKDGTSDELAAAEAAVTHAWAQVLLATRVAACAELELIRRYKETAQQQLGRSSPGELLRLEQHSTSAQQEQQPQHADNSSRPWMQHMDESSDVMAEQSDLPCCLLHYGRLKLERRLREARVRLQQQEQELQQEQVMAEVLEQDISAVRQVASDEMNDTWTEMLGLQLDIARLALEQSRRQVLLLQQQQEQNAAAAAAAAAALCLLLSRRRLYAQLRSAALDLYSPFTDEQLRDVAAHREAKGSQLAWRGASRAELARMLLDRFVLPPFDGVVFQEQNWIQDSQLQELSELLAQQRQQQQQQDRARRGRQATPSSNRCARGRWMWIQSMRSPWTLVAARQQLLLHVYSAQCMLNAGRACTVCSGSVMQQVTFLRVVASANTS